MAFAMSELRATKVDVNEQNSKAVNFYKKLGFETRVEISAWNISK